MASDLPAQFPQVQGPRPALGRLIAYYLFAWTVSFVCVFGGRAAVVAFFDLQTVHQISFLYISIAGGLAILHFGSGAFVLGTILSKRLNFWMAIFLYVFPLFALEILNLVLLPVGSSIVEGMHADSRELMDVVDVLLNPLVSICFFRLGRKFNFSRPNAALNIPWQHWLWILPTSLFPAICVPVFLVFLIWKIDLFTGNVESSIFTLPDSLLRVAVFFILIGVLVAICSAYKALSTSTDSTKVRAVKAAGAWLLIAILQGAILLYRANENVMATENAHRRALRHYSTVIQLNPNDSMAYVRRGREYATVTAELRKSLADYDTAIRLNPGNAAAHLSRARACEQLEQQTEAAKAYTAAIGIDADKPGPYLGRAHVLEKLKLTGDAQKDYKKATTLNAKDADGYFSRACAFMALGRYDQAIEDLTQAKQLDPNNADIYNARAVCYQKSGEAQKAATDRALAGTCLPRNADAYEERGQAYFECGDFEKAIADMTHAISLKPGYAPFYQERGRAYARSGEAAAAKNDLDQAQKLDPRLAK